jgi:hypothetical protein
MEEEEIKKANEFEKLDDLYKGILKAISEISEFMRYNIGTPHNKKTTFSKSFLNGTTLHYLKANIGISNKNNDREPIRRHSIDNGCRNRQNNLQTSPRHTSSGLRSK